MFSLSLETHADKTLVELFHIAALKREAQSINYINIEKVYITMAIDKMSLCSATGSRGFPAILLKQGLAEPIQIVFLSFLLREKKTEIARHMSCPQKWKQNRG